jgi:methylthioribose-1-phosphate isomerase
MSVPPIRPIEWLEDRVRIIDQTRLPEAEVYVDLRTAREVADAIKTMKLRGAPLIGVAAAMGVAIESRSLISVGWNKFELKVERAIELLRATRPTATNLFWALDRMNMALGKGSIQTSPGACSDSLVAEALRIYDEDLTTGIEMGRAGESLIDDGCSILTHCNAGALATSGFGTALAPVYAAASKGRKFRVFADETRPLLQGARLTAWELSRAGIDVTVICDGTAHSMISRGKVNLILVGADRITRSGDAANKIGTYGVAVSAERSGVPFYVVAPVSTIDFDIDKGEDIPIEERSQSEITHICGTRIVPSEVTAFNPAFDVTPAELVSGFVTEMGLITPPYRKNIASLRPEKA